MAEGRRFALTPQLDIEQILQEARNRWLRPSEVCEILRNYQKFQLTPDPPYKPPGGSLFLFDRKALRYFRKDGHRWRKKKDGKTVREAHEKLKSGSVDVLHCYYAHGEDDENFQRRSYWMLDGKLEHIVLVHYREVNEGSRVGVSHLSNSDTGPQDNARFQTTVTGPTSYVSSPSTVDWSGHAPSSELEDVDSVDAFGASRLADSMSGSGFQITPIAANNARNANFSGCGSSFPLSRVVDSTPGVQSSFFHQFYANQVASQSTTPGGHQIDTESLQQTGFPGLPKSVAFSRSFERANLQNDASMHLWPQIFGNIGIENNNEQRIFSNKPDSIDVANPLLGTSSLVNYGDGDGDGFRLSTDAQPQNARTDDALFQENQKSKNADNVAHHGSKSIVDGSSGICQVPPNEDSYSESRIKVGDQCHVNVFPFHQSSKLAREESDGLNTAPESVLHDENGKLKKLDSFGRWMNKEIGKDCDDSLMASDSGTYWNALDTENDDKEVSSFSRHIQLDTGSLGPSLSQEQFFTILDFSPDWAYSDIETKVLISGTFLGGTELGSIKWGCMFGELEVQAEVLTPNVIRCRAPCHTPGRVPFYITCSNRLACSEIREFEYRKNTHVSSFRLSQTDEKKDEIKFQIRFAKMLTFGVDSEKLVCCLENCSKCSLKKLLHPMLSEDETEWSKAEESKTLMGHENPTEALLQKLLKSRLYDWLIYKAHEVGKGPNVLDKEGQGVIHLAAALGYEWAMGPIVAAGVSPSFRDAHGWTGLHWAACFGREETVVTLVRLGAAPGALEDPTSKVPHGRTAADLASSRGHKGIAGYLAEADLTSHLSSLTVKESVIDSVSANLAAEKAVETVEKQSVPLGGDEGEQLSLRGSLAAVRNSAQAAARIQAAFRIHSFRRRQLVASSEQCMEVPSEAIVFSSKNRTQRTAHPYDPFHLAAVKIQQKYRGWKGRKEFISIRNRIVKIQAHVRGHQVRKQYKKVVWSVGIVEKAILRWRRKGTGLRGFRAEKAQSSDSSGCGKSDEYDFLRLGRKQKVAGIEKALARVQSMVRYPEARDQYMRLVASSQKSKLGGQDMMMPVADKNSEGRKVQEDPLA